MLSCPCLLTADASSQESPESDTEKEKCQPWPSFNTAESSGIDGDTSDDRPATQWPDVGSPPSQSDVENEPDGVEEGEGSDPPLLSGAVDIPSATPQDELPVTANNVMEQPQKDNCHLEACETPPSIDDLSGHSPSIDDLSGPPPSIDDLSGPPPSVIDLSGGPPSIIDLSGGPPPSVVDLSGGPPPSVIDLSGGPPPSVVDIPTDTTLSESCSTVFPSAGSNHSNHILPPVVPTGKRAALRQKKGFKMAINFTQSVGVASLQPGGVPSIHPVGVAGMQPRGVMETKSVMSTDTIGGMPPLQDCGDSD